ncbi:hypothetical protein PTTG_09098 [Puccinia triticina 1-1 BBBD Race 1]|uniref:Spindle pole body component n=1 Tax=Puccinia triticina (isolate 1-1 / race 1 (BBBD)) TaxID=630390 RepID=A0A180GJJ7_PUCT1|nr:hypothetical protein PTTG_09098 [Puccinia triticina 1-1 BBBD Race 1]
MCVHSRHFEGHFTTSLDSASHELGKKLRYVNVSRLQNQFRLAIRNPRSWSSSDPYEEDVKVTMATTSLTDWLLRIVGATGLIGTNLGCLDALQLNGPLPTLVGDLTENNLALSIVRQVSTPPQAPRAIPNDLLDRSHQIFFESPPSTGVLKTLDLQLLRAQMLTFAQSLDNFICFKVLRKNCRKLEFRLANKVDTVNSLLREYRDFLDTCLKECMLTNKFEIVKDHDDDDDNKNDRKRKRKKNAAAAAWSLFLLSAL